MYGAENRESYEITDPERCRCRREFIRPTRPLGRAALKHRLHVLGVELEQRGTRQGL